MKIVTHYEQENHLHFLDRSHQFNLKISYLQCDGFWCQKQWFGTNYLTRSKMQLTAAFFMEEA